jgi:hypothetical protein
MLRCFLSLIVLFFGAFSIGFAQENNPPVGKVEVIQDQKITELEQQYKKMNMRNQVVDGYRIQIFFDSGSNSKKRATDAMDEFVIKYPTCRVFLSYKEPYYRVRAGNFRTLNEAVGFQKRIISDYPNAFPVKEKINFKELE